MSPIRAVDPWAGAHGWILDREIVHVRFTDGPEEISAPQGKTEAVVILQEASTPSP